MGEKIYGLLGRKLGHSWSVPIHQALGCEGYRLIELEPEELESAAYQFVELYREGGEMHERGGCAVLVESMVFTKEKQQALGIPDGTLPIGWWIGFKVTDEDVWSKVKTYLSIVQHRRNRNPGGD